MNGKSSPNEVEAMQDWPQAYRREVVAPSRAIGELSDQEKASMKLHFAGHPGSGYGWGVCCENLIRELGKLCGLYGPDAEPILIAKDVDAVFMPLADHDFNPISSARAKVNLAYTFFEYPLGPKAAENAAKYDVVFCGSTWCLDRMKEKGITNGQVLIQGVDQKIFSPQPPRKPDGQFRIFSGGKFEYRKGQDLVIAAFKEFSKTHTDAHLVCSWFNPWPGLLQSMNQSTAIKVAAFGGTQAETFASLLRVNGVTDLRFTILPQFSQSQLSAEMHNTDIGLFPNRCEGGTNLVLMEYVSCGRKVISNPRTGHADIAPAFSYYLPATEDENRWAVHSVADIVEQLEVAYEHRDAPEHWMIDPFRKKWTWKRAAQKIVTAAKEALTRK